MFFKAVVQAVMLFGSDTWVLNYRMVQDLGSFQHGVARWITGVKQNRQEWGGMLIPTVGSSDGGGGL